MWSKYAGGSEHVCHAANSRMHAAHMSVTQMSLRVANASDA